MVCHLYHNDPCSASPPPSFLKPLINIALLHAYHYEKTFPEELNNGAANYRSHGELDADLIMIASRIPDRGESVLANDYREAFGGKGANSAIATYWTCHQRRLENERMTANRSHAATAIRGQSPPALNQLTTDYPGEDNIQVKMIGAVGDDRYGEDFIIELNENGIDVSGIVVVPNTPSSICFFMVEHLTRDNRCLFMLGATATWKKEDFINAEQLGGGIRPDLVVAQMEIDKEVVETMIETAGKTGIEFCLNMAPAAPIGERFYRHLTHLLANKSEASIMSGRDRDEVNKETWPVIAQEFLNRGVKNVVITLDVKVRFTPMQRKMIAVPRLMSKSGIPQVQDTFMGAYASDYLRQKAKGTWDIRSAIIRASKAAAITIQTVGAQEGIPWADEIDNFDVPTCN